MVHYKHDRVNVLSEIGEGGGINKLHAARHMKFSTAQSAFVCLIMISFKIYDKWNYSVIIILSSNSLESKQQLDQRRLEDLCNTHYSR